MMELNEIRPFLLPAMDMLAELQQAAFKEQSMKRLGKESTPSDALDSRFMPSTFV